MFVSHSSKDKATADVICAALEAEGVKCWIAPRDINPGQEWPEAIVSAVASSRAMILIFSDNANLSKDVAKEALLAINLNIDLFPLKIENAEPTGTMQYYLADKKWLDAIDQPVGKIIETLFELIKPLIPDRETDPEKQVKAAEEPEPGKPVSKESKKNLLEITLKKKKIFFPIIGLAALLIAGLAFFLLPPTTQPVTVKSIAAGSYHSFILLTNGEIYAFGNGSNGRLGLGDEENRLIPIKIQGLSDVKTVSTGHSHTLIVLGTGEIYSCGDNKFGQLGLGDDEEKLFPTHIENLSEIENAAAGTYHSLLLLDNGEVYSWGAGWDGQLGHGTRLSELQPVKIEDLSGAIAVATNDTHSLVLLENGDLYSFGKNYNGQLGHGDTEYRYTPTKIERLSGVQAVETGKSFSLVLLNNGDVYSFGTGREGQLGHTNEFAHTRFSSQHIPKKIDGLSGVTAISAGEKHALVLTNEGIVYSFGSGEGGMLGHADEENRMTPTKIEGLEGVVAISAGHWHSLILTEDGTLYAFGQNTYGQLGLGDTNPRMIPTPVEIIIDDSTGATE